MAPAGLYRGQGARANPLGAPNLDDDQRGDPHDEVVRLEEHIEDLAVKIESCRKLISASRIAVVGGVLGLTAMLFAFIRFDPAIMAAAVAALLGGIAVWGSNNSTAQQAAKELASVEAGRSALIEEMDLSNVTPLRELSARSQDGTTA